ncbi:hypothetical protein [Kingella potus]|uniref:hypothetical protein n=1 Tax=Kingella potus TaxID=265175 RepID=UPI001FD242A0|nr:hypothetical protein [Kingella potus]UOP00817.1 hypothetical protein LVJ84_13905 [Kingella potus]
MNLSVTGIPAAGNFPAAKRSKAGRQHGKQPPPNSRRFGDCAISVKMPPFSITGRLKNGIRIKNHAKHTVHPALLAAFRRRHRARPNHEIRRAGAF